jgi:hypothetical protein
VAQQVATRFTKWEFSEKEAYVASRFTQLNMMLIQSLIADEALRKTNLTFDAANPTNFAQQEAEIVGAMRAYEHLLLLATETEAPVASEENKPADISRIATSAQPQTQNPKGS